MRKYIKSGAALYFASWNQKRNPFYINILYFKVPFLKS